MRKAVHTFLAVLLLMACLGGVASSHAYVARSTPGDGETLLRAPKQVKVWFTESIEPKLTTLKLVDAQGKAVSGTTQALEGDSVLILHLPSLASGAYTVQWQVLSTDSHVTKGTISFTVAGETPAPTPTPTPGPEPAPSPGPTPPPPQPTPTPTPDPTPPPAPPATTPAPTSPEPATPAPNPAPTPTPEPTPSVPSAPSATTAKPSIWLWGGLGVGVLILLVIAGVFMKNRKA